MKISRKLLKYLPILVIVLTAAVLRFWRLDALTTFGGDQGYDFLIIKKILEGNLTLLGPKIGPYNELGNLYLGPAYYYLLAPALWLSGLDPKGAAVLTVISSIGAIVLIYFACQKFFSTSIAVLASSLYAVNTVLINQSRASSNPHIIPFFSALSVICTFQMLKNKKMSAIWPILCGAALGIIFQLHYLGASLLLAVATVLIVRRYLKKLLITIASFIVLILPQIIFELRHDFFVTRLFLKQLNSGKSVSSTAVIFDNLKTSTESLAPLFAANQLLFLGLWIIAAILAVFLILRRKEFNLFFLFLSIILNLVAVTLYKGEISFHYFATIYVPLLILFSILTVGLWTKFRNPLPRTLLALAVIQIFAGNILTLNLSKKEGYTMPAGMNLIGQRYAAKLISADASGRFNIASTLDGDTRAMPYRYLVEIYGKNPEPVEAYPGSESIYLITRDEEQKIKGYTVWEVASFAPFEVEKTWDIQNGIKLHKLKKS